MTKPVTKTERADLRLTPETILRIAELARIMGPTVPLSRADVVTECVRQVHETETNKEKRR